MFSRVRARITYTNVAVTLALVFAMSGGAYAAGKYLISSTKQISPKVLKQLQGKAGAQGPAGAQGSAGPQGPAGAAGEKGAQGSPGPEGKTGKDGTNGESVVSAALKKGEEGCTEGGSKFTVTGKTTTACNGAKGAPGSPWTPESKLPSEATETGTWLVATGTLVLEFYPEAVISFPVALAKPLETKAGVNHYVTISEVKGKTVPSACTIEREGKTIVGSAEEPVAKPGNLCVYEAELSEPLAVAAFLGPGVDKETYEAGTSLEGAGRAGTILAFVGNKPTLEGHGTWAVTAE